MRLPKLPEGVCRHDTLPKNWAFESRGAVFQGGIFPDCDQLVQGKFLGNAWTKEETVPTEEPNHDSPEGKEMVARHDQEFKEAFDDVIIGGEKSIDELVAMTLRHAEEKQSLPKRPGHYIRLGGLDFSRFEEERWVVRRIP